MKVAGLAGKVLKADREYIGNDWFKALTDNGLYFVIRLRKGNYKHAMQAAGIKPEKIDKKAIKKEGAVLCKPFELGDQSYHLLITAYKDRNGKTVLLRLITSLAKPYKAIDLYKLRYRIESMFKHLKSNGFELQSLQLQSGRKIRLMMALPVFSLSVTEGLKKYRRKYPPLKHGSLAMSVFRVGIERWQNYLSGFVVFLEKAFDCFCLVFEQKQYQLNLNLP